MSAGVKKKCPECSKLSLERLIGTGSAVIFKGSGFYETDYRSKSYTSAKEEDSKAAKKATETKTDTKSESKPEKKTETKPEKTKAKSKKE